MNKLIVVLSALALLLLFIIIAVVFVFKSGRLDTAFFSFTAGHSSPACTRLMRVISFLGKHSFLIPANILLLLFFIKIRQRWWAIRVAVVSLSSLALMSILKNLFHRLRPENPMVEGITNYGFPSGHSIMGVAFYGLLISWFAIAVKNKWQRGLIISFLLLVILLIGYSRIYLRVHYATDVLAGYCTGIIWLVVCFVFVQILETREAARKN